MKFRPPPLHFKLLILSIVSTAIAPFSAWAVRSNNSVTASEILARSTVILIRKSGVCSGVILSHYLIATAAHCISKSPDNPEAMKPEEQLAIYSGNMLRGEVDQTRVRFVLGSDIVVHPEYSGLVNNGKLSGEFNDIALIHVKKGLPLDLVSSQIKWNISDLYKGTRLQIAGFGQLEDDITTSSMILRKLEVSVVEPFIQGPEQIVMRPINEISGVVRGDSGGPAFLMNGDTPIVLGVASFGSYSSLSKGSDMFAYELFSKHQIWISETARSFGEEQEVHKPTLGSTLGDTRFFVD